MSLRFGAFLCRPDGSKASEAQNKANATSRDKTQMVFHIRAQAAATNWQLQFVNTKFTGHALEKIALQYLHNLYGDSHLPKFEECLQRLEKIVHELEKGDAPLEKSLTLFEEGMQLSAACRKELEQAEGKVEILLKQNGKLQAVAFESQTERTPASR
jgi:exodeoxyribonuclease VII small subunit